MILLDGIAYIEEKSINNIPRRTLRHWRHTGRLPFIKRGGTVLVNMQDVASLLHPRTGPTRQAARSQAG